MTVFRGGEAVEEFLAEFDGWLSESVEAYLLGGSAMTVQGLKDQTRDIDLALGVVSEFTHVFEALQDNGFTVIGEPTESFDDVGTTVELRHPDKGFQVDLFERQVVGKVWLSERMRDRAEHFWSGEFVTTSVLADEDMFLLKQSLAVTSEVGDGETSRRCGCTHSVVSSTRRSSKRSKSSDHSTREQPKRDKSGSAHIRCSR